MSALKEVFLSGIKNSKGKQTEKIIEELLYSDVLSLNEFLLIPCVKELNKTPEANKYYNTLYLFSTMTYYDYKKDSSKFLALKEKALFNLKCVSIQEMAKTKKHIDFNELKRTLDINSDYEIEKILFILISNDLVNGKIDSLNKCVDIISVKSRNNLKNINNVEKMINKWIDNCYQSIDFINNEEKRINEETKQNNTLLKI